LVTGTDTGVGKTVLAGAIIAALRARGVRVGALKPVITGLDEAADPHWPRDHELLAAAAGSTPPEVTAIGYGPAVSPHLAAALAGRPIVPADLLVAARRASEACETLIVEGVGGLRVPLVDGYDVRAFAVELGLPLLIAARPGLGTINHTLLTLEAARSVGLAVAAVVLTPWPAQAGPIEHSNRETIARIGEVSVATLPPIARGTPELLAGAGERLPLDAWFPGTPPAIS
jgi:dethiobiotin synthetase